MAEWGVPRVARVSREGIAEYGTLNSSFSLIGGSGRGPGRQSGMGGLACAGREEERVCVGGTIAAEFGPDAGVWSLEFARPSRTRSEILWVSDRHALNVTLASPHVSRG
jgi:hypothetical protein